MYIFNYIIDNKNKKFNNFLFCNYFNKKRTYNGQTKKFLTIKNN